jgi:hypothetical protein
VLRKKSWPLSSNGADTIFVVKAVQDRASPY